MGRCLVSKHIILIHRKTPMSTCVIWFKWSLYLFKLTNGLMSKTWKKAVSQVKSYMRRLFPCRLISRRMSDTQKVKKILLQFWILRHNFTIKHIVKTFWKLHSCFHWRRFAQTILGNVWPYACLSVDVCVLVFFPKVIFLKHTKNTKTVACPQQFFYILCFFLNDKTIKYLILACRIVIYFCLWSFKGVNPKA